MQNFSCRLEPVQATLCHSMISKDGASVESRPPRGTMAQRTYQNPLFIDNFDSMLLLAEVYHR